MHSKQPISVVFASTPEFGLPTLEKLFHNPIVDLKGVITQPDRKKGRGQKLSAPPIKQAAQDMKLPVFQPLTKHEFSSIVQNLAADIIIVIAYGMIIPKQITRDFICLNAHASLLPFHRGASPIQSVILTGSRHTGVTIIQMDEYMDHGPIVTQQSFEMNHDITVSILHDRLSELSAELMGSVLEIFYDKGTLNRTNQQHNHATYCQKIATKDREILPIDTPKVIDRKIRAFSPSPGAFIQHDAGHLGLIESALVDDKIDLIRVKPAGKKEMLYKDFKRGHIDFKLDQRFL